MRYSGYQYILQSCIKPTFIFIYKRNSGFSNRSPVRGRQNCHKGGTRWSHQGVKVVKQCRMKWNTLNPPPDFPTDNPSPQVCKTKPVLCHLVSFPKSRQVTLLLFVVCVCCLFVFCLFACFYYRKSVLDSMYLLRHAVYETDVDMHICSPFSSSKNLPTSMQSL